MLPMAMGLVQTSLCHYWNTY